MVKYQEFNEKSFIKKIIIATYFKEVLVKRGTNEEVGEKEAENNKWETEKIGKMEVVEVNVSGKDYYTAIKLDPTATEIDGKRVNILGQDLVSGWTTSTGFGMDATAKAPQLTNVAQAISKALKRAKLTQHPDKNGKTAQATYIYDLVVEAPKVIGYFDPYAANDMKKQYDLYYQSDLANDHADNAFKSKIKTELDRRSKKTDPAAGDLGTSGTTGDASSKEEKDISMFRHLFPKDDFINRNINALNSKKAINQFANGVIYIYLNLHRFDLELKGRGSINTKRPINEAELGTYANFKTAVYELETKTQINDYLVKVEKAIADALTKTGTRSEELAHNINIDKLHRVENWDLLEGADDTQLTEKFHFVQGYRGQEGGIRMIRSDDPENDMYANIIQRAKVFAKFKKKCQERAEDLKRESWWGKLANYEQTAFQKKILELGKLEIVEVKELNSYGIEVVRDRYTKMKYQAYEADQLNRDIQKIFDEAANKAGSTPDGHTPDTDQAARNAAINKIKQLLRDNKVLCGFSDTMINGGSGSFAWKAGIESRSGADIGTYTSECLLRIYRTIARKTLEAEAANKGKDASVYGVGDLATYFKGFHTKDNIETAKDNLLKKLEDEKPDRLTEVEAAIAEIRAALTNVGISQAEEFELWGKNWETLFKNDYRYEESSVIETEKQKALKAIETYLAKKLAASEAIIADIEQRLKNHELSEDILGTNWKENLKNKSPEEREAEKDRLVKLIEAAVKEKGERENWNDKKKKNWGRKIGQRGDYWLSKYS